MNSLIGLMALFVFGFFIGAGIFALLYVPKPQPRRDDCSPTGLVRVVRRRRRPYDWADEDNS